MPLKPLLDMGIYQDISAFLLILRKLQNCDDYAVKDKTAILLELDDLKQVRDELTEEVRTLTTDLEKERSKSKSLRSDQDRQSEKMEKSEKHDKHDKHDRGKVAKTCFFLHFLLV